jgi:GTP cyclohydrolase II
MGPRAVNGLREVCHCGHDRATHHPDEATKNNGITVYLLGNCLGLYCDCLFYVNENEQDCAERTQRHKSKAKPKTIG